MTGARVDAADIAALAAGAPGARVDAADIAVLAQPATAARVDGVDVSVLLAPGTGAKVDAIDLAVLAYVGPCATRRCQLWRISRRDGQVFRYTSLDIDFDWIGGTYRSCHSLSASASESSAELQSVGNVELTGILDDDGISEADLYGGLFDDAYVEIWLVPYDGQADDGAPTRLAAGWTGKVSRGEHSFTAEVLGPGGRLQQASLVEFYTPGCRWDFGDTMCGIDAEARKIAAVAVTGQTLRTLIQFSEPDPGGSIWRGGKVRWLTGRNAGVECQVDTVDFTAGALSLWDLAPFAPAAGDTFDLLPGCTYDKPGCITYANLQRYGGFPDVPGPDALQSNADSLFTGNG